MVSGQLADVHQSRFSFLGGRLADQLNFKSVTMRRCCRINGSVLLGRCPVKRFSVVGIFAVSLSSIAAVSLFALRMPSVCFVCPGGFTGYRVACRTCLPPVMPVSTFIIALPRVICGCALGWSNLARYQAISVKGHVVLLFSLLIAVAAFNLVSGLIMIVEQRRGDIAVLRSMGASRFQVLALFACWVHCWVWQEPWRSWRPGLA